MVSSAATRVYVLEGQYAQLSTLGFPVSLVMELQQGGLRLSGRLAALTQVFRSPSGQQPCHLDIAGAGKGGGSQEPSLTLNCLIVTVITMIGHLLLRFQLG